MAIIIPIKEMKNTANISKLCNDSDEPVYVTKNGYGDLVVMSQDCFDGKYNNDFAAMLRRLFEEREFMLNVDNCDRLIRQAKTQDERIFYIGVYNAILRIKQNEVIKNEKY